MIWGGGDDWAEGGLCDLMTGGHDKLHPVACRLYDRIGRVVADFVSRGAHPKTGSPVAGSGNDT